MRKSFLAVLLILLVVVSAAFADDDLLRRSIMSCTYAELVRMAESYGLETSMGEEALRSAILGYFGLKPGEKEQGQEQQVGPVTSISIDHADYMNTINDVIIMSGSVKVTFTAENSGKRTLVAGAVAIDLKSKIMQATGDVVLEDHEGDKRTFRGQVVSLDWNALDVIVFDGLSTTTRKNSGGTGILFFVSGKEISYDGDSSGVFFDEGTIATWKEDPYWSISAKKLSLSQNDLFIDRAIFRLGRVPVFYFPVFFYPGTTLSFNPSIGLSSNKGAFMSTTYEIYGQYPRLGQMGSKSSSSSSSDSDDSSAITGLASFFESENKSTMIHDGIFYRELKEGEELSPLEKWARDSGSYMAVFADVYQNLGAAVGIDTLNKFLNKRLGIGVIGVASYRPVLDLNNMRRFRYSLDFNLDYKYDNLKVVAALPIRSDPAVRVDFLNRNTAFSIDSLLGTTQYFPTTYSSQTTYTWSLDSSYRLKLGNFNFNLSSLKADVDYNLVRTKDESSGEYYYESQVKEASLPYLSFSSDGVILDLRGQARNSTTSIGYSNFLAKNFSSEQEELSEELQNASRSSSNDDSLTYYKGPDLKLEKTTVSEAGSFKLGYTYNQTMDNVFKQELARDNYYTKISGTLYADAAVPGNWLKVTETLKPQFNHSLVAISEDKPVEIEEFYLSHVLAASVPKVGLTYNLTQRLYIHYTKTNPDSETDRWGAWDATDVTAHNASISKTWSPFTLGFYVQLKPMTEILKPSFSYSRNGFNASADFSMKRPDGNEEFEKGVANLNLSYKNGSFSASVNNSYDFAKVKTEGTDPWKGYTLVQDLSFSPLKGLSFKQSSKFVEKFVASSLSFSGEYLLDTNLLDFKVTSGIKFTGEDYEKDSLNVGLRLSQDKTFFWKKRITMETALDYTFNYDFMNPFRTYMTAGLSLTFNVAEFIDFGISINSANKSFSRYYDNEGNFVFQKMIEDLLKSFDFFGNGRKSTGFNLSSFKVKVVHYMRDWNLYIDAQGSMTTQYSGKYEWVPTVTVYVKWNAIPELKTQGAWDASNREWK